MRDQVSSIVNKPFFYFKNIIFGWHVLDQGGTENDKVEFWSRKGELGRLDILGANADIVLRKVLHPVVRFVFKLTWSCFWGEKK
jgi:hypothetical protein